MIKWKIQQERTMIMINFIVYDDEKKFLQRNKKTIDKAMMNCDYEYRCYLFDEYNDEFENIINDNIGLKIYLLDIEGKNKSGLDIVRTIREKYNDWSSIIILITNHNELKYDALSNRLYLMDFINKLDKWDELLEEDINRIINTYGSNKECLVYEFNHSYKRIELKNITYIEKEKDSKKCIIHTLYGNQPISSSISDIFNKLDNRFIKTSRSTIINIEQISEYDKVTNQILFLNGSTTNDVSRLYKKDVIKHVFG